MRVPRENLVGEPGMGWTYAKYLLEKERTASAFLYFNKRELEKAREIARDRTVRGTRLIDTPEFARKLARVEVDVLAPGVLGAAHPVAGEEPAQPRRRGLGA